LLPEVTQYTPAHLQPARYFVYYEQLSALSTRRFNRFSVVKIRPVKQLSTHSRRNLQQLPFPKHTSNTHNTSIFFFYLVNQ